MKSGYRIQTSLDSSYNVVEMVLLHTCIEGLTQSFEFWGLWIDSDKLKIVVLETVWYSHSLNSKKGAQYLIQRLPFCRVVAPTTFDELQQFLRAMLAWWREKRGLLLIRH